MQFDSKKRSFIKAISYRFFGSLATTLITFSLTKNLELSVAAGVLDTILKIAIYFLHERVWQKINLGREVHLGKVLWLTGLSGSGKTTLAKKLELHFKAKHQMVVWLDGDQIRKHFPQLGFSRPEREDHIKRVALTASLLEQQGTIVIVSLISPYLESRYFARELCQNFHEIFLAADIDVCKKRDVKGLYKKAEMGALKEMTGVDSIYEVPVNPELILETGHESVTESFVKLKKYLHSMKSI